MAGSCSSLWVKLLLAAMLSASLPGNMGESERPCSPLQAAQDTTLHLSVSQSTDSCTSLRLENLRNPPPLIAVGPARWPGVEGKAAA